MKTTLSILVSVLLLAGCEMRRPKYVMDNVGHQFMIVELDSCEYIYITSTGSTNMRYLVHKGNCKYCEKRRKEEVR